MMEELESLIIAFQTLAKDHEEMKRRVQTLERAVNLLGNRFALHENNLNAHEL